MGQTTLIWGEKLIMQIEAKFFETILCGFIKVSI